MTDATTAPGDEPEGGKGKGKPWWERTGSLSGTPGKAGKTLLPIDLRPAAATRDVMEVRFRLPEGVEFPAPLHSIVVAQGFQWEVVRINPPVITVREYRLVGDSSDKADDVEHILRLTIAFMSGMSPDGLPIIEDIRRGV